MCVGGGGGAGGVGEKERIDRYKSNLGTLVFKVLYCERYSKISYSESELQNYHHDNAFSLRISHYQLSRQELSFSLI